MSYLETLSALGVALAAGVPTIVWGDPGQGKTSVLETYAKDAGRQLETVLASIREPADFAGLPIIVGDETRLAPPDWARSIAGTDGILFFDEISTAPAATQAAMLRVVFDRVAGDLHLGDKVSIVAAANAPEVAADGWDLAPPLANRFLHLDWILPADIFRNGIMLGEWPQIPVPPLNADDDRVVRAVREANMLVGAFVGARPDYASRKPTSTSQSGRAWPSPRTWEMAARLVGYANAAGVSPQVRNVLLVGAVGEAAAGEFSVYVSELDLPDPEKVLAKPEEWDVPTRGDRVYAIATSVYVAVQQNLTDERWKAMGPVLAAMAQAGHADVAVSVGRRWMAMRPRPTLMPDQESLSLLIPVFREAQILP